MSRIEIEELVKLYGSVPSFHDAYILEIAFNPPSAVRMKMLLWEEPANLSLCQIEGDDDLYSVVWLRWEGLSDYALIFSDFWLYELEFIESADKVTTVTVHDTGKVGRITAERVVVEDIYIPSRQDLDDVRSNHSTLSLCYQQGK